MSASSSWFGEETPPAVLDAENFLPGYCPKGAQHHRTPWTHRMPGGKRPQGSPGATFQIPDTDFIVAVEGKVTK